MSLYQIAWYFVLYSFFGWCVEVIYHAAGAGIIVNRGFLCGPVCPVYGFGVIGVFGLIQRALPAMLSLPAARFVSDENIWIVLCIYLIGVVVASAIELFAGWVLDKIFHARWWDYSREPFNLHGYICLRFSLIWGFAILLVVRIVQPILAHTGPVNIPERIGWWVLAVIYAAYLADLAVTVMILIGLNKKREELNRIQSEMHVLSDQLTEVIGTNSIKAQQTIGEARVQAALAKVEARDAAEEKKKEFAQLAAEQQEALEKKKRELQERMFEIRDSILAGRMFSSGRIFRAFPELKEHLMNRFRTESGKEHTL